MMTHKERALAPFFRKSADRFPMWYGGAPETTNQLIQELGARNEEEALYGGLDLDFRTARPRYIGPGRGTAPNGGRMCEWGIVRGGLYGGQALTHPLAGAESAADVESYHGFENPDEYETKISEQTLLSARDYCLIGGCWAPFFHDAADLIGMEEFFVDMYTSPSVCEAVIDRCFSFYYELDRRCFEENPGKIDMYFLGNDFGTQRSLLMAPEMWRQFFKPRIAKLIAQAKKNGCVTAMHSCGDIHEIIADLIEIGVDAINPIQVGAENMNPETLIAEFGDDCVFFGGIDENKILKFGTEREVRNETRRMIDILGSNGRYIVAASHDYLLPEIPARNIIAMYDEAKKYQESI